MDQHTIFFASAAVFVAAVAYMLKVIAESDTRGARAADQPPLRSSRSTEP